MLLEWHHWRFCCYPWWAPISPAPPATGKQAFVLCGRAAHVFFSFACGHFTVHVSHSGNRMLWLKNDNRHELSHPELSSCSVGILWHPQCPIYVSRCLFDVIKKKKPGIHLWIHLIHSIQDNPPWMPAEAKLCRRWHETSSFHFKWTLPGFRSWITPSKPWEVILCCSLSHSNATFSLIPSKLLRTKGERKISQR